jgi:tRNA U34 5-methylaminomethyl-2-thiouridine-forming methyltransferase MnmC
MNLDIILTSDGSKTIYSSLFDATYHSRHGAVSESRHIFVKNGLQYVHECFGKNEIAILEVGFGTGLNSLLSLEYASQHQLTIDYSAIDKHIVPPEILERMDYEKELRKEYSSYFSLIHSVSWGEKHLLHPSFSILKTVADFKEYSINGSFDLVYFDAFSPRQVPDMWTKAVFEKLYQSMLHQSVLVTFCAQGQFKRDLKAAGFKVERLPGAPGKR